MASIFLDKFRRRGLTPVTFMLLEVFKEMQAENQQAETAQDQLELLRAAFMAAGVEADEKSLSAAFFRLNSPVEEQQAASKVEDLKMGKTISEYLQSLDPVQLCMMASDFDVERAERLYCETDFEIVRYLAAERTRWEMVSYFSRQEAIAIGFGGVGDGSSSGKGSPRGSRDSVDVAKASTASLNDRLGFLRGTRH